MMVSGISVPISLSIATIAPAVRGFSQWSKLKKFQKELAIHDLGIPNTNIIAEARGWQTRYYDQDSNQFCQECSWYGWSYVIMSLDGEMVRTKDERFCEHFARHHNGFGHPSGGSWQSFYYMDYLFRLINHANLYQYPRRGHSRRLSDAAYLCC